MIEKYVDAEELRRLLSTLIVVVGALMIAGLFASIVVPGLRNANEPAAAMPVNPVVGDPGWLDPTEFPPEKGKIIPPVDAKDLIAPSQALVSKGKDLFEKNCTQCHGESGAGDGPAAGTMDPRPRNLASPQAWVNGPDLPAIFKTLSEGIRGSSMAAFDFLAKKDRMALAHYVQTLGTFSRPEPSHESVASLSKTLASRGERTADKIPVSQAMTRLEQEFHEPTPLAAPPEDLSPGAELLHKVVVDPMRAARILSATESWRPGAKELAKTLLSGAPENGFSANLATMGSNEWQLLHAELLRRIPPKK